MVPVINYHIVKPLPHRNRHYGHYVGNEKLQGTLRLLLDDIVSR